MPTAATRAVLRPSRTALRRVAVRNASTTSEAASAASAQATKAKEAASQATSKASEGLSKVTSSASSTVNKARAAASSAASSVGGRAGSLISTVQSLIPPTVYYSKVALEFSKIIFRGQKMNPPTVAQFQSYFQPLINGLRNPSHLFSQNPGLFQPQQYLNQVRNMSTQQAVGAGIIFAEVLGFFTVGEIIGRAKIVGYRAPAGAHEHH